jgi:hypothetical protein
MPFLEETRITPLAHLHRERLLPARGEVLVAPGEPVGPADVIARCRLPGGIEVVDVGRALRLPPDRAARCVLKAVGDIVHEKEVLAAHRGVAGRLRPVCRAPVGGRIVAARDGLVLIEAAPTTFELRAHLKGQVARILPGRGAIVDAEGALIQGVWGSGGEAEGLLKLLVDAPDQPLRGQAIDMSCDSAIVVGGSGLDELALDRAVRGRVRAIVVGSLGAHLCPAIGRLPFPVVITEGFGSRPMSGVAFSLLQENAGREAMLDAETRQRWGMRRPEIFISARPGETPPEEGGRPAEPRSGLRVRGMRAPYQGAIGHITGLPRRPLLLESGVRLPVAEVTFADRAEPVLIPLANLEVIR